MFYNTVASLNTKYRSFEKTVKKRLQEKQGKARFEATFALQAFNWKLKEALDTKKPPHVKEET